MDTDKELEIICAAIYCGGVIDKENNPELVFDLEEVPKDSRIRKAVAQLQAWSDKRVLEARVDENQTALKEQYMPDCAKSREMVVDAEYHRDRIAHLKSSKAGDE